MDESRHGDQIGSINARETLDHRVMRDGGLVVEVGAALARGGGGERARLQAAQQRLHLRGVLVDARGYLLDRPRARPTLVQQQEDLELRDGVDVRVEERGD